MTITAQLNQIQIERISMIQVITPEEVFELTDQILDITKSLGNDNEALAERIEDFTIAEMVVFSSLRSAFSNSSGETNIAETGKERIENHLHKSVVVLNMFLFAGVDIDTPVEELTENMFEDGADEFLSIADEMNNTLRSIKDFFSRNKQATQEDSQS